MSSLQQRVPAGRHALRLCGGAVRYTNWLQPLCEAAEGLRAGTMYMLRAYTLPYELERPPNAVVTVLVLFSPAVRKQIIYPHGSR